MILELEPTQFISGIIVDFDGEPCPIRFDATKSIRAVNFKQIDVENRGPSEKGNVYEFVQASNYSFIKLTFEQEPVRVNLFKKTLPPMERTEVQSMLRQKRIVFLGAARDCGDSIQETVKTVRRLSSYFSDSRFCIFENDSIDETLQRLESIGVEQNGWLEHVSESKLDDCYPERTERLAYVRNLLLQRALSAYPSFDYICVIDCDGIIGNSADHFNYSGFLSSFKYERVWDAVFPVTEDYYYDIWALRHEFICPYDYLDYSRSGDAVLGRDMIVAAASLTRQLHLKKMTGWLEVDSAFGGMGVYKLPSLRSCIYAGRQEEREVCEHVPLHQKMKSQGCRLYINPEFRVLGTLSEQRTATIREFVG